MAEAVLVPVSAVSTMAVFSPAIPNSNNCYHQFMPRPTVSPVWNYFDKKDGNCICKCKKAVKNIERNLGIDSDEEIEIDDLQLGSDEGLSESTCGEILKLAVIKTLQNSTKLPIIETAREVVKKLRTPNTALLLEKYTKLIPILDNNTRWLSVFDMLERLYKLKNYVDELALYIKDLYLSKDDWDEIRKILECLKSAKIATLALQRENFNFCDLYNVWIKCELSTKNINHPLAQELYLELQKEKKDKRIFSNAPCLAALYLNPRFNQFMKNEEIRLAVEELTTLYIRIRAMFDDDLKNSEVESQSQHFGEVDEDEPDEVIEYLRLRSGVEFNQTTRCPNTPLSKLENIKKKFTDELKNFVEAREKISLNDRIEEYWLKNESYKRVRRVANIIYSTAVTQVSVERTFSDLRFILDPLRCSLKGCIVNDLLLLRNNYNIISGFEN